MIGPAIEGDVVDHCAPVTDTRYHIDLMGSFLGTRAASAEEHWEKCMRRARRVGTRTGILTGSRYCRKHWAVNCHSSEGCKYSAAGIAKDRMWNDRPEVPGTVVGNGAGSHQVDSVNGMEAAAANQPAATHIVEIVAGCTRNTAVDPADPGNMHCSRHQH